MTKSVVACYNASELLTKREAVSNEIRSRLIARAKEFNIILEDVSITHLNFSPVYNAAVESKKVAEQEAERAKCVSSPPRTDCAAAPPPARRVVRLVASRAGGGRSRSRPSCVVARRTSHRERPPNP